MKISHIFTAIALMFLLTACKGKAEGNASIKENSNKNLQDEAPKDYMGIDSEALNKHILAHFDLGQYELGKEKLKFLIKDRPELVETLNLAELEEKFDTELEKIRSKKSELAERERKKRMPNATKMMRIFEEGDLTYYVDNASPKFDSKETFHAYYTKDKAGVLKLYLRAKYIATSWLNINSYMITADQLDYDFTGEVMKQETKGKKKYKHETLDELIDTPEELEMLNVIANAKDVKAVYIGKSAYKERVLSNEQITSVRNVLDAYLFSIEMNMPDLKRQYANKN